MTNAGTSGKSFLLWHLVKSSDVVPALGLPPSISLRGWANELTQKTHFIVPVSRRLPPSSTLRSLGTQRRRLWGRRAGGVLERSCQGLCLLFSFIQTPKASDPAPAVFPDASSELAASGTRSVSFLSGRARGLPPPRLCQGDPLLPLPYPTAQQQQQNGNENLNGTLGSL